MSLLDEQLLPLKLSARFFPLTGYGRKPHLSALVRYVNDGRKAADGTIVKLEAIRGPAGLLTSHEAVRRFLERLACLATTRPNDQRRREQETAERVCSSFGA